MRTLCIAVIAAGLMAAPMASAQPLAPGKPAGVKEARHGASTGLLIVSGLAVAALVAVVALGSNDNNNAGVLTSGVSGTTTATTSYPPSSARRPGQHGPARWPVFSFLSCLCACRRCAKRATNRRLCAIC